MALTVEINLDDLKVPGISGYTPAYGTMKPAGDSLTTLEVIENMALSYLKQKNFVVNISDDTDVQISEIEYNATVLLKDDGISGATPNIVVTLPAPVDAGVKLILLNSTTFDIQVTWTGNTGDTIYLPADSAHEFVQSSLKWYRLAAPVVKNGTLYV